MRGADLTALLAGVVAVAVVVASGLRWLRVAQREHYIAGRARSILTLWLSRSPLDRLLAMIAIALAVTACALLIIAPDPDGTWFAYGSSEPPARATAAPALHLGAQAAAVLASGLALVVPRGLGVRGRTSALRWTGRLRRLTGVWAALNLLVGAALVAVLAPAALVVLAVGVPVTVDVALAITDVLERRLSAPFVAQAQRRLARVRPQVVAVTGSYGKTSTKGYIAHLLSASTAVVASPASFNNRLGLSRAINDGLVDGTEVFVAEMGTYGPGEIRELCTLFPPDVAAITVIGEAHLERMGSVETILAAKSEITERARTVVLPIDTPDLAGLADRCRAAGKRVITCSTTGRAADVVVDLDGGQVTVPGPDGTPVSLPVGAGVAHAVNLAVAVGVALGVGVDPAAIGRRLDALPRAAHRAEVQDTGTGVLVVDDTYNANPIGARAALDEAAALAERRQGRLVVVTPGIVELGHMQHSRNADFARAAGEAGAHVVVVGRTNRGALLEGAREGGATVDVVDRRPAAVPIATAAAGPQGVVLYENDLPDHYP